MGQISPPIRVLLVAAVAFLAAYMLFLRPRPLSAPEPAATTPGNVHTERPAGTELGKATEAAQRAAEATNRQLQQEAQDAGAPVAPRSATGTRSARPVAPRPAGAAKVEGLPLPVLRAIADRKVLALLFWNGRSPDDRATHAALGRAERFGGEVFVRSIRLRSLARYGRITRGVDVEQSPTLVVVDRRLRATKLVGYADTLTIEQAIVDAMRASGGLFRDAYLRRVNNLCSATVPDFGTLPQALTPAQTPRALRTRVALWDRFVFELRAIRAPARWRALRRTALADATALQALYHRARRTLGADPSRLEVASLVTWLHQREPPLTRRFNRHMDAHDLIYCGRRN